MDKTSKKPGMKKGPAQGEQPCRSVQPKGNKTPLQALLTQDWRERGGGGTRRGLEKQNKQGNQETRESMFNDEHHFGHTAPPYRKSMTDITMDTTK